MHDSGTRRIGKRTPDSSCADAPLCAMCRQPMVDEVKHCINDTAEGFIVLCDSCYFGDERRNAWEYRGVLLPKKSPLFGGRRR
jgi:hypothetical protein